MRERTSVGVVAFAAAACIVLGAVPTARAYSPAVGGQGVVSDGAQPNVSPLAPEPAVQDAMIVAQTTQGDTAVADTADQDWFFLRGRGGPSLGTDPLALGTTLSAMLGYENSMGVGVGVSVGARWLTADHYSYLGLSVAAVFRVSALPKNRFHPFGEIGISLNLPSETTGDRTRFRALAGGDFALGLEIDITPQFSLDLGGRGEVLVRNLSSLSVYFTPFLGFVTYL